MKKYFIPVLAGLLIAGVVTAATYTVKDNTKDETLRVVEKTETKEVTTTYDTKEIIDRLEVFEKDFNRLEGLYNQKVDEYNEAVSNNAGDKLKTLKHVIVNLPTLPKVATTTAEEL